MATTTHWAPNSLARSVDELGRGDGGGVHGDLVGPGPQQRPAVRDRAHSAADRERDEDLLRGPLDDVQHRGAVVRGGGDVKQHELVGAFGVVARGELDRVAGVAKPFELDALSRPGRRRRRDRG